MSIPMSALTGGAGGAPLDSPNIGPPPQRINPSSAIDEAGEGSAPIPFPGEEDDRDEGIRSGSEVEGALGEEEEDDVDEVGASEDAAAAATTAGTGDASTSSSSRRGGATAKRGRGRGRGAAAAAAAGGAGGRGLGNNVEQAKVARAITAGKKAANLPGTSQLPTARVKKIITSDPDVDGCGKEATFAIGKACELYIHHLVEEAYTQARLSQRKAIYYKDISKAIRINDHLDFLEDVVPNAIPLSKALEIREQHMSYDASQGNGPLAPLIRSEEGDTASVNDSYALEGGSGVDAGGDVDGFIAGNGTGAGTDGEGPSSVGGQQQQRVKTHAQLTSGGKKVVKKSKNIRATQRAAREAQDSSEVGPSSLGSGGGDGDVDVDEGEVVKVNGDVSGLDDEGEHAGDDQAAPSDAEEENDDDEDDDDGREDEEAMEVDR